MNHDYNPFALSMRELVLVIGSMLGAACMVVLLIYLGFEHAIKGIGL